ECRSAIIQQALERNARIPFAGPQALAIDKTSVDRMHGTLLYAHRQHHAIVSALERGEGARVEALMRDHTNPVKENLKLQEGGGEVGGGDTRLDLGGGSGELAIERSSGAPTISGSLFRGGENQHEMLVWDTGS